MRMANTLAEDAFRSGWGGTFRPLVCMYWGYALYPPTTAPNTRHRRVGGPAWGAPVALGRSIPSQGRLFDFKMFASCRCLWQGAPMETNLTLRRMSLTNWFGRSATYELPERGVTLVTGRNGLGKSSSTIDATCYALYGKTFREEPPRDPGVSMKIEAEFYGGLKVDRKETGRSSKGLEWGVDGKTHAADTKSKDAAALSAILPPIDNWKRTHVFAASAMVAFSNATDLSRKQLLEEMVGIGQFDASHKLFLQQRRAAEGERARHAAALQQLEARIQSAERVIADTTPPPEVDIAGLEERSKEAHQKWRELDEEVRAARSVLSVAEHALARARAAKDKCPTCGAPLGDGDHIRQVLADAQEEYNLARKAHDEVLQQAQPLQQEAQALQRELAAARGAAAANERLRKAYDAALAELDELTLQSMDVQLDLDTADHQVNVYKYAGDVIQSARGKVFDEMLQSIESLSNSYLEHLMPGLRCYLEVVPGRAGVESVKLLVDRGDGVRRSYRALSSGQQRRVDIAILLSLSQLSPTTGTLFFDEAFDTLDPEGLEAVSELLTQFGKHRSVVVISPNPVFAKYLTVDLAISVSS